MSELEVSSSHSKEEELFELEALPAYGILSEKEKTETKAILEKIRGYFRENTADEDPISVEISRYPGKEIEDVLERYFIDVANWKSFRIIAGKNVAYATFSASMDCPIST